MERIPLSKPSITEVETALVADAAANGWGEHCYDYIHRFEKAFAEHIGVRHAIATSSCTGALTLGLAALGVGPGDEVILAESNWVASVAPVLHLGAKPVLVDILEDTWCLDPEQVRRAITPRTKAIIAVHLYGNVCEMDELLALGREHGIAVIEDAAESMGALYHGTRTGALGRFGAFSFHGSKTMTTGEGGMFVTDDSALYEQVLTLSNHGRARGQKKQFWPDVLGYKFKISNIQAALGCGQLQRIEALIARKREILAQYREALADVPGLTMNAERAGTRIGGWMPTVVFPRGGVTSERMTAAFQAQGIDGRVFFHPLSSLPFMGAHDHDTLARDIAARAVNLPSFHDMTAAQIARVADAIRQVVHG